MTHHEKLYITVDVTGLPQVRDMFTKWRTALLRYGDHEAGCAAEFDPTRFVIGEPPDPCDCGWSDIEARLTREDNAQ